MEQHRQHVGAWQHHRHSAPEEDAHGEGYTRYTAAGAAYLFEKTDFGWELVTRLLVHGGTLSTVDSNAKLGTSDSARFETCAFDARANPIGADFPISPRGGYILNSPEGGIYGLDYCEGYRPSASLA